MTPLKATVTIIVLWVLSQTLNAQATPTEITTKIFKIFKTSPTKAMDYAFSTNPYLLERPEAIAQLKKQYNDAKTRVGTYQGFELITEKSIGKSYRLYSYLVKHQRIPLRFTFILYIAKDTWRVNQLFYDSNLLAELEASAKQDRL